MKLRKRGGGSQFAKKKRVAYCTNKMKLRERSLAIFQDTDIIRQIWSV